MKRTKKYIVEIEYETETDEDPEEYQSALMIYLAEALENVRQEGRLSCPSVSANLVVIEEG